ncbi:MAG TPA: resolvase [Ruminococcaceae bacterium]|nr:resolvase [Oscillospiraceae bacterium]
MQGGKVSMAYKHFLGYEKGPDSKPQIVESEAKTVRRIYELFLSGSTYREIAARLTAEGVPTPSGKSVWHTSAAKSILQNEKYSGNAILQKKYTVDFLTKKQKINEGEVPQYYVENSHPAIIPPATFELVQDEIRRREQLGHNVRSKLFTGRVICGECGGFYGPKVWNSGSKYRSVVWRCNGRYRQRGVAGCRTPHLTEEGLKAAFVRAWAALVADRDRYISGCETELASLVDTAAFDKQTATLTAECAEAAALVEECIAANAASALNQAEYQMRYDALVARYDSAKIQLDLLKRDKLERMAHKEKIHRFADILRGAESAPDEFDEKLWREVVETMTVHSRGDVTVKFCGGMEILADSMDFTVYR